MTAPYPVLRIGSVGDSVRLLQGALNLAPTLQPRLTEDGQFGPKTNGRVREFQGQKKLVPDGVVGPLTWAQLEPMLRQLMALIDRYALPVHEEEKLRQRIVDVARSSFDLWGWGPKGTPKPDGTSGRIAAAFGYGPSIGDMRARQGGPALATIYSMAGAGGANCLAIRGEAEKAYKLPDSDPNKRGRINQDIGSWCGIFATYCLRAAGLTRANWDRVSHQDSGCFTRLGFNDAVRRGDIGVYKYGRQGAEINHHFVVVEDAGPGAMVHSIDGNVGMPDENVTATTWYSVISERKYFRKTLQTAVTTFLRPNFAALR
jgi:hypothetical protein